MSYTYLLDLQEQIDKRLDDANSILSGSDGSAEDRAFQEGRIDALLSLSTFLTENLHPKLPRAIRNRIRRPE